MFVMRTQQQQTDNTDYRQPTAHYKQRISVMDSDVVSKERKLRKVISEGNIPCETLQFVKSVRLRYKI